MVAEIDTRKVKKGRILTIANIPTGFSDTVDIIDFTPKTITKIAVAVWLTAGGSMTITLRGIHEYPIAGSQFYVIYLNEFIVSGIAEILGCSFHIYDTKIETDASTTGRVHIFHEYDYDLIK